MNLATLYRNHPDLALLIDDDPPHLVACHDCGLHYPPREMLGIGYGRRVCVPCFERREDTEWGEWLDRLAKEGRGVTA